MLRPAARAASVRAVSLSPGAPDSGTVPPNSRKAKLMVLLTKLPRTSASSLFLTRNSAQVKSLSLPSGALIDRVYLIGSGGNLFRYSPIHTAVPLLVDCFCPEMLRNSLAGMFQGSAKPPRPRSMAGSMIAWKTMLSLPMKWISRVSGLFHQFSHSSGFPRFSKSSLVLLTYPRRASNQT